MRRSISISIFAVVIAILLGAGTAAAEAGRPTASAIEHGFHARIVAHPGQGDALVALLFDAPVFDHPDCRVFLISRSKSDRDVVFVTEGWVNEEAHAAYAATEEAQSYTARFGSLVADWATSDEVPLGGKAELE